MDKSKIIKASELFKVLGSETRLTILYLLKDQELNVSQIIEHLNLDQSLVSHQLKILKEHDLVRTTKSGKNVIYRVADSHIIEIYNQAIEHVSEDTYE